jgi:type II secretory pathway component GspD/PulD (secretin)
VADLVVGHDSSVDPNQALLAMLAEQNEELVMALASAQVGASGAQQDNALTQLANTIEATFADEFEGRGSITLHQATKTLIVRQTEETHVEISDLLTQLRHFNDTQIKVAIELVDLDTSRSFALAHNGQLLDAATLQEFHDLVASSQCETMTSSISIRNGESKNLMAYGLPGTLTAVVSEDQDDVRLMVNMPLSMEMGLMQQHDYRVPPGGTLLTVFTIEDSGVVVVLTAECQSPDQQLHGPGSELDPARREQTEDVSGTSAGQERQSRIISLRNSSVELVAAAINQFIDTQLETAPSDSLKREVIVEPDLRTNTLMIDATLRYFDEVVDMVLELDAAPPQIMTEVVLVEAKSLPEDFFSWAVGEFDGAIHHDPQSHEQVAVCLEPATCDQFIEALRKENVDLTIHSRPQVMSLDGQKSEIRVGQVVPVVDTVSGAGNRAVPVVEQLFVGTSVSLLSTIAADKCIKTQIEATHREPILEELTTPPAFRSTRAATTLTVPQMSTIVWPVRPVGDEAAAGPTMLVIFKAREVTEEPAAE